MLVGTRSGTLSYDHRNLQSLLNKPQREEAVSDPLEKRDRESRDLAWGHVTKQLAAEGLPPASALPVPQLKIPNSATKTWCRQINK